MIQLKSMKKIAKKLFYKKENAIFANYKFKKNYYE